MERKKSTKSICIIIKGTVFRGGLSKLNVESISSVLSYLVLFGMNCWFLVLNLHLHYICVTIGFVSPLHFHQWTLFYVVFVSPLFYCNCCTGLLCRTIFVMQLNFLKALLEF